MKLSDLRKDWQDGNSTEYIQTELLFDIAKSLRKLAKQDASCNCSDCECKDLPNCRIDREQVK